MAGTTAMGTALRALEGRGRCAPLLLRRFVVAPAVFAFFVLGLPVRVFTLPREKFLFQPDLAPRPYAGRPRGGSAPSSPRRPISDDPAGISPYSHWTA